MATRKKPSKAAAAKAEVEERPEKKTIEWRGLTLELPDFPPRSLVLRGVQAEDADGPQPMLKMLKRMIGEEQYESVVRVVEHADDEDEALSAAYALCGEVFAQYGVDEGESEAS